jgi:predicted ester cyclase
VTEIDLVLDRLLSSYNRGDVDGVLAEAEDDVEYVLGSRGVHLVGREAWRSVVMSVVSAIPGRRMHVSRRVVSGDAAVIEWVIEGVSSGQVAGYPVAGELVRREGCSVIGFDQGHIVSFRDYVD